MNSSNPQTRKPARRADAPEIHCLSSDLKRLRGLHRELLRASGEKQQKLQADLAALIERSRAAVQERRAKLPKPEFQADLPVNERRADIASRTIVQLQPADIGKHLPPVAASRTAAN